MKEGWMKSDEEWWRVMKSDEEWWRMNEGWRMNDGGWWFQDVKGFWLRTDGQTDRITDICECRVAFATEKNVVTDTYIMFSVISWDLLKYQKYSWALLAEYLHFIPTLLPTKIFLYLLIRRTFAEN